MQMHEQFRVKPEAWDYNSFPNPFTDNVTIKCSPADYNFLTIFDISGRQLIKIPIHTNEQIVNLQQLMQGAYLIKLSGMHSQFHLKLVKK